MRYDVGVGFGLIGGAVALWAGLFLLPAVDSYWRDDRISAWLLRIAAGIFGSTPLVMVGVQLTSPDESLNTPQSVLAIVCLALPIPTLLVMLLAGWFGHGPGKFPWTEAARALAESVDNADKRLKDATTKHAALATALPTDQSQGPPKPESRSKGVQAAVVTTAVAVAVYAHRRLGQTRQH